MNRKKISPIVSILIILIALSGCEGSRYVVNTDRFRINDFPTPPHNYRVETYFAGEKLPEQEYIRTHLFPVYSGGSAAEMVKKIHSAAETANVDAVIILSPEQYQDYESSTITSVTGIGIKFKGNVDYLHNYRFVDKLYVFDLDSMDYRHIADLFPNFNNQIFHVNVIDNTPTANYYYGNFVKKYSLPFLLEDKGTEWRYQVDEKGIVRKRSYYKNNQRIFSFKIDYENNRPALLIIKSTTPGGTFEKRNIRIDYNQNNQVAEKTIFDENKIPLLKEVFSYDEEGKLLNSVYYKINSGTETPFLKTDYIYFRNEDVYEYF